jgi:hypothetical protein
VAVTAVYISWNKAVERRDGSLDTAASASPIMFLDSSMNYIIKLRFKKSSISWRAYEVK